MLAYFLFIITPLQCDYCYRSHFNSRWKGQKRELKLYVNQVVWADINHKLKYWPVLYICSAKMHVYRSGLPDFAWLSHKNWWVSSLKMKERQAHRISVSQGSECLIDLPKYTLDGHSMFFYFECWKGIELKIL